MLKRSLGQNLSLNAPNINLTKNWIFLNKKKTAQSTTDTCQLQNLSRMEMGPKRVQQVDWNMSLKMEPQKSSVERKTNFRKICCCWLIKTWNPTKLVWTKKLETAIWPSSQQNPPIINSPIINSPQKKKSKKSWRRQRDCLRTSSCSCNQMTQK